MRWRFLYSLLGLNLSTGRLDLSLCGGGNLVDLNSELLRKLAITQNLDWDEVVLNNSLSNQSLCVYGLAICKECIQTSNVDWSVLNTVVVSETRSLGRTHSQWLLSTLEASALTATRAGELTIHTAAGKSTIA